MAEEEKKKNKKRKGWLIALFSFIGLCTALLLSFFIYVSVYYHADNVAAALESDDKTEVSKDSRSYYAFEPKAGIKAGLIFYPGGKVENTAYAPLCHQLAEKGIYVSLTKMPFNLSIFNQNAGKSESERLSGKTSKWYLGGHSLGGFSAAECFAAYPQDFQGLVLLGAYAEKDLSQTGVKTLTMYGTEDGVLNKDRYEADKKNLPADNQEIIIHGGCHSYFGSYGMQKGDGTPTITREEQISQTVSAIASLLLG
jgi:hypothetical protein